MCIAAAEHACDEKRSGDLHGEFIKGDRKAHGDGVSRIESRKFKFLLRCFWQNRKAIFLPRGPRGHTSYIDIAILHVSHFHYTYHDHKCHFPLSRRRNSKTKAGIGAGMYGAPLVPGTASTGASVASAGPPSLVDVVSGRAATTAAAAAPGNAMTPAIYSAGNAIFITAMSRWHNVS